MTSSVLVVDDHAVVRDGLRVLLELGGEFRVVGEAADGREAVAAAERLQPDLVVLDLAMPEMDGVLATQRIRERCPRAKILILSMHLSAEHVYRALRAGAHGYLLKESAGAEVVEAMRALLAGRRYLSHRITQVMVDSYAEPAVVLSPIDSLSLRERDVLQLVVDGRTSAEIAERVALSVKSVETYRVRIMRKLGVRDTIELVKFAMRHGITS